MFSIARHDESENDERSYEKRLDRLSKLNERVSKKRKQTGADQGDGDDNQSPQEELATVEVEQLVAETTVDKDTAPDLDLDVALVEEYEPKKAKRNKPKKKKTKHDEPAQPEALEEMEVVEEELVVPDELIPQTLDESVEEAGTLEEGAEEESMLQAFPDFTPTEPDAKDVAQLKSMGIPYWLAHPTIIEQGQTTPLAEMSGLSKNLLERCREQGIDEFFAGALD
jgi:hypothetical protein